MDIENTLREHGILDVIRTLSANGESGRLQITNGTTNGDFFLRNGLLVDARVGNLTGFQAINAAASMRDGSFSFDPTVVPPAVSSIRPNERVVLKQFFGIDTVATEEIHHPAAVSAFDDAVVPVPVVPLAEPPVLEDEPVIVAGDEEATVITSHVPSDELGDELRTPAPYVPASNSIYRGAVLLALLFILLGATAVMLRYRFRERVSPAVASVATTVEASSPRENTAQPVQPAQPAERIVRAERTEVKPSAQTARSTQPAQPAEPVAKPVEPKKEIDRASSAEPVAQSPAPSDKVASADQDLTGKWTVVNTVSKTSFGSFKNMAIGFDLSIKQTGNTFTGTGRKISENGRSLPAGSRTPIYVKGSIDGDKVEATFFEEGTLRKTNGRFVWRINKADGGLSGTFNSTAARTSGRSSAGR